MARWPPFLRDQIVETISQERLAASSASSAHVASSWRRRVAGGRADNIEIRRSLIVVVGLCGKWPMRIGSHHRQVAPAAPDFLAGGGELSALMRSHDWTQSPLGAPERWPDALKMSVSICLNSRFPMVLWWGPEFATLYNDAYRPILGATKHPGGLGRPGIESWPEIWDIIGVQLKGVWETGQASWSEDLLLVMDRYGYHEEAYFTYSYSPIKHADGTIGGVFTAVNETTARRSMNYARTRLSTALYPLRTGMSESYGICQRGMACAN
jgi:hypothetical protein